MINVIFQFYSANDDLFLWLRPEHYPYHEALFSAVDFEILILKALFLLVQQLLYTSSFVHLHVLDCPGNLYFHVLLLAV
ncbi:unnamed protein product [Brugia timori]|uniref:Uncharacterized protein n=1 Tax=Brugia timori TaxID=42155 RepID=A0A3P7VK49_9BILA|nr:unnamed protein product [Brugia timori]